MEQKKSKIEKQFSNENTVKGLDLYHSNGSSAKICTYGATVTSYQPASFPEILFTSKKAYFDESRAIRGGIPLVFPQFGPGELPSHGFARTSKWKIKEMTIKEDDSPFVVLTLTSSPETLQQWPHAFQLHYEINLQNNRLITQLHVTNTDSTSFDFQMLQHTYLALQGDILELELEGLQHHPYIDQVDAKQKKQDDHKVLKISNETDRIYVDAPDKVQVNVGKNLKVEITKSSKCQSPDESSFETTSDLVVWNPWIEKSKRLSDFEDEEYRQMLCVEPGKVSQWTTLPSHGTYTLSQTISLKIE